SCSVAGHLDITEMVYNSLTSLNNTDKFYEKENEELELEFNVELSSLLDAISDEELQKENIDFEIGCHIIAYISEEDAKHPELDKQRDTPTYLE
ncbi:27201_t:CDS:2, partial [Racocetra persica]